MTSFITADFVNCPKIPEIELTRINREAVVTIIFGFSILVLSNFIPTIYFGVFTGLAMLLAMLSVLTLLPKLILTFKE